MYRNGKVDSHWGSMPPKLLIISTNSSNKSCRAVNFLQKKVSGRICLPLLGVELGGPKDCLVIEIL